MASSEYTEWRSAPDLDVHVACLWRGRVSDSGQPHTDRILPDACVDLIFDGNRLFVAGPDTRPVPLAPRPRQTFVGIRMRPGHARVLLGRPACELLDQRVDLPDLWPRRELCVLADQIGAFSSAGDLARAFEAAIRRRLARSPEVDPVLEALLSALGDPEMSGTGLVDRLAAKLGTTVRTLHRRCVASVGYGPKMLDRVLRFQRARALARAREILRLDELALAVGYADQAHMTRECRRLSGLTPSELFKTRSRGGATVAP